MKETVQNNTQKDNVTTLKRENENLKHELMEKSDKATQAVLDISPMKLVVTHLKTREQLENIVFMLENGRAKQALNVVKEILGDYKTLPIAEITENILITAEQHLIDLQG